MLGRWSLFLSVGLGGWVVVYLSLGAVGCGWVASISFSLSLSLRRGGWAVVSLSLFACRADLREDKMINPDPGFRPMFGPSGTVA